MNRAGAGILVLVLSLPATADDLVPIPAFDLELLHLDAAGLDSVVAGGGRLLPEGRWRGAFALHHERNPLTLAQGSDVLGAVVSDRLTIHAYGAWAFRAGLQLEAQLSAIGVQAGEGFTEQGFSAPAAMGLGSPVVGVRAQLVHRGEDWPFDLSAAVSTALPLGRKEALASNDGFSITPHLAATWPVGEWTAVADVGALVRPAVALARTEIGSQLDAAVAFGSSTGDLRYELVARGLLPLTAVPVSGELLAVARYRIADGLELFGLGGPGFGTTPGQPQFRIAIGVGWLPPPPPPPPPPPVDPCATKTHTPEQCPSLDDDRDGILNAIDRCPYQPEDLDAFEDDDGCPDPDNDDDGFLDLDDWCPLVPGVQAYQGCPVPDVDGDGILDADDKCPEVPGVLEYEGCPVPDRDADGVLDHADVCPDEPGPKERAGCPIRDRDHDDVEDLDDACPDEPGLAELLGCPARDTDGDSVPDHLDNCPSVKGVVENAGCPRKVKLLVIIRRDHLELTDTIHFATGKATILPPSFPMLNQVARLILEHAAEIPLVHVDGHTDERGTRELNLALSLARAEAVRQFLIRAGVARNRLIATGFGPDRPVDTNATDKGRGGNRRVEFRIARNEPVAPEMRETPKKKPSSKRGSRR